MSRRRSDQAACGAGWIVAAAMALGLGGCAAFSGKKEPTPTRFVYEAPMMGTVFRVICYAGDEAVAKAAADAAFDRARQLNRRYSDYEPQSEVSLLSASSPQIRGVAVSDDLLNILLLSERWSYLSDGAFDVTVGPMVKLWRGARHTGELPPAEAILAARRSVGFGKVHIDPRLRTVRLAEPGMVIDFGGIAKGYAADEMLRVLREKGCPSSLVDAGGSVVAGDAPPDAAGWRVALMPEPIPLRRGDAEADALAELGAALGEGGAAEPVYVTLVNAAVATSGDAFQHVEIAGRRFSHIVDPRTGIGLTNQISASVIVRASEAHPRQGADADAMATALCVLGRREGLALAAKVPGSAALLVQRFEDGAVETSATPELDAFLAPTATAEPVGATP